MDVACGDQEHTDGFKSGVIGVDFDRIASSPNDSSVFNMGGPHDGEIIGFRT